MRINRQELALEPERLHAQPLNALERDVLWPNRLQVEQALERCGRQIQLEWKGDNS